MVSPLDRLIEKIRSTRHEEGGALSTWGLTYHATPPSVIPDAEIARDLPPSRFLTCPDPVAGRPGVDPALVARLLGLPLLPDFHAAGQMLEVRVPWLPVSLWFVPDESAAEALVGEGVSRGRVWTAHELVDLLRVPEPDRGAGADGRDGEAGVSRRGGARDPAGAGAGGVSGVVVGGDFVSAGEKWSSASLDHASEETQSRPPTCGDAGGRTKDGKPCPSPGLSMGYPDGRGRCHTAYVTAEQRKATGRSGGSASRGVPDPAAVPPIRMGSRKETAAARAEIASLAKARALSPPVASVVLTALKHADEQRDRAAQLKTRPPRPPVPDASPPRLDRSLGSRACLAVPSGATRNPGIHLGRDDAHAAAGSH